MAISERTARLNKAATNSPIDPSRALQQIPNIGPAMAADLIRLGITSSQDLADQNPDVLYTRLCRLDGVRHDPCVHDVFAAAVSFANGGPPEPWWFFSRRRKARGFVPSA
jgi:Pathogenicity locus